MNLFLVVAVLALSSCADHTSDSKSSWLCCDIPPAEWPKRHWKGQDYKPSINPERGVLNTSYNESHTMFSNTKGLTPDEFIKNLKDARIIKSVQNDRTGFFNQTITEDIVITLDHNFYTLSYSDQKIITELLAKSFDRETYILKDAATKKVVGQITPDGFVLF